MSVDPARAVSGLLLYKQGERFLTENLSAIEKPKSFWEGFCFWLAWKIGLVEIDKDRVASQINSFILTNKESPLVQNKKEELIAAINEFRSVRHLTQESRELLDSAVKSLNAYKIIENTNSSDGEEESKISSKKKKTSRSNFHSMSVPQAAHPSNNSEQNIAISATLTAHSSINPVAASLQKGVVEAIHELQKGEAKGIVVEADEEKFTMLNTVPESAFSQYGTVGDLAQQHLVAIHKSSDFEAPSFIITVKTYNSNGKEVAWKSLLQQLRANLTHTS